jgi:hypothetical protein
MNLHLDCDEDGAIFHDSVELLVGEDGVRRPWHRYFIYYSHFTITDNEKLGIVYNSMFYQPDRTPGRHLYPHVKKKQIRSCCFIYVKHRES